MKNSPRKVQYPEQIGKPGPSGKRVKKALSGGGGFHEAEIQIELRDAFYGTTKSLTFQVLKQPADGQVETRERTLQVHIPKGVTNGSVIQLDGQGGKGLGAALDSDLLLRVTILPDPRFRVVGHNLHTSIGVSPWEVILGAEIPVKTVDGTVNLSIPAYSQNGQRFRLKGMGIPKKGAAAGDIIIEIDIRVPHSLSEKEVGFVEELSRISRFNPRDQKKKSIPYTEM